MALSLLKFADLPVVDCHVHLGGAQSPVAKEDLDKEGKFMVKVSVKGRLNKIYVSGGHAGIYLKAKYPNLFYAGGFVPWTGNTSSMLNVNWSKYIQNLINMGFDGIGEMGSKPVPRKLHTPLDSDYYKGFWEACESFNFPVLCHVADPEEFWDEKLAPDWAKRRGWVYYGGDYPSKEELYKEIENVLERHPNLKIVLCHFYFMSANLERAAKFLDNYKNANFDLTLGIELIYNISKRRDEWRDFFIKYCDRILFGTDIATWQTIQEAIARVWLIRNFLETNEEFFTPATADDLLTRYREPFLGLRLPDSVLRKIYAENFNRLWGNKPRKINIDFAIKICEQEHWKGVAEALRSLP
ncbi:MAG: amidohydrolase family protein [Candidatus Bathyarchaeia archaeon]|nr:amidohydrolase family protein [Candidatus Bathyarchaeota archaeon]